LADRTELAHAHAFGLAVDAGGQWVTRGGLTLSAGYGLQYLAHGLPQGQSPQVLPRLIVTLGWSL
jgi:hypothetical protein